MYIPGDEPKRTARAPAKLNLYLDVGERRDDGFHDLETLIVPIRIWDSLTLSPTRPATEGNAGPIELTVHGCGSGGGLSRIDAVPAGEHNLVYRALELLQRRSGCRFGARVDLVKRIPTAAGLGGGSSDAAAVLRLANQAWRLRWRAHRLAALGAELGSDVPFFLSSGAAICRGRGELVERLPGLRRLHFVVVKPPLGLSTSDVYRASDDLHERRMEAPNAPRAIAELLVRGHWSTLRRWMHNSLQSAAASLTPWVDQVSALFDRLDCAAHQLSGSGSAYFGVCRHATHARRLAAFLRTRQLGLVYATSSCQ
jgi:4-diphosphocytidyl-2-C-methyl-D-erythritol kinase